MFINKLQYFFDNYDDLRNLFIWGNGETHKKSLIMFIINFNNIIHFYRCNLKISAKTIQLIKNIITGESSFSPYRSGPKLVEFFSQFGSTATYDNNFPSRAYFTERELLKLNNFEAVIEALVDPRDYLGTNFSVEEIVKELNKYLLFDGYELLKNNLTYKVFSKMPHNIKKPSFVDVLNDLMKDIILFLSKKKNVKQKLKTVILTGQ